MLLVDLCFELHKRNLGHTYCSIPLPLKQDESVQATDIKENNISKQKIYYLNSLLQDIVELSSIIV